jgi:phage shock protein A
VANLFKRINEVITANISDLIDRVEDPEKMIKQIIREMEENIARAKDDVVDAIASEKTLLQDVEKHRDASAQWQQKARTALKEGNEELARTALVRKNEHDKILESLEPALESAINTSASLKSQLKALEAKLDEAKRKRSSLVARQRAAEARERMTRIGTTFKEGLAAQADFTRMEDRVGEIEARSAAISEVYDADALEQEFLDLEAEAEVDAELAALKRELGDGES